MGSKTETEREKQIGPVVAEERKKIIHTFGRTVIFTRKMRFKQMGIKTP